MENLDKNIEKRVALLNAWWFAVSNKNSQDHKRVCKLVRQEVRACGFPFEEGKTNIKLLNAYTKFLQMQGCWITYGVGPVGVCCTY